MRASAGTPTSSPTTRSPPTNAERFCASTSKPCARSYTGEFVDFGPSWAWPKPAQSHVPLLIGGGGTQRNFDWIARSADGWITTPYDTDIDDQVEQLLHTWTAARRAGSPEIVALGIKPDRDRIAQLEAIGVTECAFGLPERSDDEVRAYLSRLVHKLDLRAELLSRR